jgi:hypothetical protein
MILQSSDVFDMLLDLNPESGAYRYLSRKEHPEIPLTKPSGAFSILNDTMLMLYRKDGVLHFRVGDRTIELGDDVTSSVTSENDNRVFQLIKNGSPEICLTYSLPVQEVPLSADPTPFVEEEDFDFLLFVHNVLTNTGRRNRIYSD